MEDTGLTYDIFKWQPGIDILLLDSGNYEDVLLNHELSGLILQDRLNHVQSKSRRLEILAVHYLLNHRFPNCGAVEYRQDGSPYLKNSESEISISHSRGLVAVLVSADRQAGLDLEHKTDRVMKLVGKFAGEREKSMAPEDHQKEYFTLLWTMKEALVKLFRCRTLDFCKDILVEPFIPQIVGKTNATVFYEGEAHYCELQYRQFDEQVLSSAVKI